jgi:hypothetical protein
VEHLFRPRLVTPVRYAGRWADRGSIEVSPGGALAFVSLVTDEAGLPDLFEGMTTDSAAWLEGHPEAPPILSVARYELEPKGANDWLHIAISVGYYANDYREVTGHRPFVDCEDLEIGVSAERRARLGDTGAHPFATRMGEALWHVRTRFGDGRTQDSTRIQLSRQGQKPWNL